jgi:membrane associated rhomboid family serine protease
MGNAVIKVENQRKEKIKMEKTRKVLKVGLMVGLISLMASPAFARSISFKGAGTALWIFIIIGAIIVLLQLIPAAILFFSFIGTTTTMAFKKGKKVEQQVVLPGAEPVVVKE